MAKNEYLKKNLVFKSTLQVILFYKSKSNSPVKGRVFCFKMFSLSVHQFNHSEENHNRTIKL